MIPTVTIYPAVCFDYHERVENMQQVTTHIPFDTAMQLISDAVTKNVEEEEKSKAERDFESEMNMEMPTNVVQFKERLLDAVYFDDDMDDAINDISFKPLFRNVIKEKFEDVLQRLQHVVQIAKRRQLKNRTGK